MTYAIQIAACAVLAVAGMLFAGVVGAASERKEEGMVRVSLTFSIALITLAILVRP